MTEPPDLQLARDCLRRATADVEAWLALLEQGQLAVLAPFAQMFIYQLNAQGRSADKAFAVEELYKVYYRRAGGRGPPPMAATLGAALSGGAAAAPET
jgi:hypothetical protein